MLFYSDGLCINFKEIYMQKKLNSVLAIVGLDTLFLAFLYIVTNRLNERCLEPIELLKRSVVLACVSRFRRGRGISESSFGI